MFNTRGSSQWSRFLQQPLSRSSEWKVVGRRLTEWGDANAEHRGQQDVDVEGLQEPPDGRNVSSGTRNTSSAVTESAEVTTEGADRGNGGLDTGQDCGHQREGEDGAQGSVGIFRWLQSMENLKTSYEKSA